jgi:hypothetical protein
MINPTQRLVVLRIDEDVSTSTFTSIMDSVVADRAFRRGMSFLSSRSGTDAMATTDYVKLALKYLDEHAPIKDGYKWAVVSFGPVDPQAARAAELLDEFRGHYVRVFDDFDGAMAWLSSDLYAGIVQLADVSGPAASSRERNKHRPGNQERYAEALRPT